MPRKDRRTREQMIKIGERYNEAIKHFDITFEDFGREYNITKDTVSKYAALARKKALQVKGNSE